MLGKILRDAQELGDKTIPIAKRAAQGGAAIRGSRPARWMGRHKVATGLIAAGPGYGMVSSYRNLPGRRRSTRNQNDWYLNRVRSGQSSGFVARSIGGMTG